MPIPNRSSVGGLSKERNDERRSRMVRAETLWLGRRTADFLAERTQKPEQFRLLALRDFQIGWIFTALKETFEKES